MLPVFAQMGVLAMALHSAPPKVRASGTTTYQGTFADGAAYLMEVPSNWNRTLVLYSHGYVSPGSPNPAYDVGDGMTGSYLLSRGYALAGSSYATTGWAVQQALPDQIQVLDTFASLVGQPAQTIAWGHSMGGLVTAGLIQQYPTRFAGALPMCGAISGGVGIWNAFLDSEFAFNTLLAGNQLQVVNIGDPSTNYTNAVTFLSSAQNSPQGRARIALAAALGEVPGWYQTGSPSRPRPTMRTRKRTSFSGCKGTSFCSAFTSAPSWKVGQAAILHGTMGSTTAKSSRSRPVTRKLRHSTCRPASI